MTRRFTKILAALALLVFMTPSMVGWGQTRTETTTTYTFSSKSWDASPANWISGKDGNQFTSGRGVQVTTGASGANATSPISFENVSQIVVTYSTNASAGAGSIAFQVGSNTAVSLNVTKTGGTTDRTLTYSFSTAQSGTVKLTVTCTTNSIYVKSVAITTGNVTPTCATPTFDPAAGTYTEAQSVSINCSTEGATIYYTTNGDNPTTNSTVYTAAINVSSDMTIKAMATAEGYDNSAIATAAYAFITLEHAGTLEDPYTVADARAAIDANAGTQGVYATGIVSAIHTAWSTEYNNITFNFVDNAGDTDFLQAFRCVSGTGVDASTVAVGDIVVVHGNLTKYGSTYEFNQGCDLVALTHPTTPSVTVTPATISAPFAGAEGTLALTYENIEEFISFDYYFCDANGNELEDTDPNYPGDWIDAEINEDNDTYTLDYIIDANDGAARTAYMKVYTFDDNEEEVYAIVTVNQAKYVVDYATLPFAFNGGKNAIEETNGLTQSGLASDYADENTKLKFDSTDDYVILKINERPGTLTFNIKGNSFSGGTFKVQTSADGVSFSDLKTYTTFGSNETFEEIIDDLNENVRYIKWVYTNKSSGNVGLGNIALAKYVAPPASITLNSYSIEATAVETEGTLTVTYTEIETELGADIYWFESDGVTTASEPDWMTADINSELNVEYLIEENEGAARTAYFKVYGVDEEDNDVYSNLVTVSQAAAPQQYTLEVTNISNAEIYVFDATDPDETNWVSLFEGVDSEQVTEGTTIALSVTAEVGYTLSSLMVNNVDHVNDIQGGLYTFTMPSENVTISATAVVRPLEATFIFNTDAGLQALGIVKPASSSGTDLEAGHNYTLDDITMTCTHGSTSTRVWNSGGSTDLRVYSGGSLTFTAPANYVITSITFTGNTKFDDWSGAEKSHTFSATGTMKISTVTVTYAQILTTKEIEANQWYLISSPVGTIDPGTISDMMPANGYALYRFDQSGDADGKEWINYKGSAFNLEAGKGYLYASQNGCTLSFTGTPYSGDGQVTLATYDADADLPGYNLVGNPFPTNAYLDDSERPFYVMSYDNVTTGEVVAATAGSAIAPMQGIFVVAANEDDNSVTFTTTAPSKSGSQVALNVTKNRGAVIDRAIVSMGEGRQLPKFQLFEGSTKVYIPQGDQDYAVVRSEGQGELPVNFSASENGTYTLSMDVENMDMNYLHLIDNMTGMDVDLLQTPSYTFEAKVNDYESRFRLVFAANNEDGVSTGSTTFAFYSNGNWIINNAGEATLQVVDLTGRILSSETVNGSVSKTINAVPGVYMLRLINGDNVNVQKIVVR